MGMCVCAVCAMQTISLDIVFVLHMLHADTMSILFGVKNYDANG